MSGEKTYRMYHMAKSVGMNTSEFMRLNGVKIGRESVTERVYKYRELPKK